MKKVLAILSIVALVSCNGNGASHVSDSTKVDSIVVVDTVAVADTLLTVDSVELGGPQPVREVQK
jgi:hypothetical protein